MSDDLRQAIESARARLDPTSGDQAELSLLRAEVERLRAELDEERERHDQARAEVDVLLPPNPQFYMDPPDGGGVDRVEIVRRYIEHLCADLATAQRERDEARAALEALREARALVADALPTPPEQDGDER